MYVTAPVDLVAEIRECVESKIADIYQPQEEESLVNILYNIVKPQEIVRHYSNPKL
jgi:hypothetical protein